MRVYAGYISGCVGIIQGLGRIAQAMEDQVVQNMENENEMETGFVYYIGLHTAGRAMGFEFRTVQLRLSYHNGEPVGFT